MPGSVSRLRAVHTYWNSWAHPMATTFERLAAAAASRYGAITPALRSPALNRITGTPLACVQAEDVQRDMPGHHISHQRGAVERESGVLKHQWAMLPLRVRRLPRVALHVDLTILGQLADALVRPDEAKAVA